MEITFHTEPWRHYRIDADEANPMHPWSDAEPWGVVPSVTQVLGVLDKSGPLVGWAVNVTCEGAWRMAVEPTQEPNPSWLHQLVAGIRSDATAEALKKTPKPWLIKYLENRAKEIERDGYTLPGKWRTFKREMRHAGLDHNTVTRRAQLRGTTVHKIGEDWVTDRKPPSWIEHPEEWRGYITAMARFLIRHGEGLAVAEQITGSKKYGFAGTCDTVAVTTFGDSRVRLDYKTSKQVYARTHFRQLAAYELGAQEAGEEPCDRLAIVILGEDGEFTIHYADEVEWRTTPQDSFLRVLDVFRDEPPLKAHEEAVYRARRAKA